MASIGEFFQDRVGQGMVVLVNLGAAVQMFAARDVRSGYPGFILIDRAGAGFLAMDPDRCDVNVIDPNLSTFLATLRDRQTGGTALVGAQAAQFLGRWFGDRDIPDAVLSEVRDQPRSSSQ
jgi:hypothetical protein